MLGVINLYVSRVNQALPWIKSSGIISRHAPCSICNSLVCAVGPWVVAAVAESVYSSTELSSSRDVSRRTNAAEDTLIQPFWRAGQPLFMSAVCNDNRLTDCIYRPKCLPDVVVLSLGEC